MSSLSIIKIEWKITGDDVLNLQQTTDNWDHSDNMLWK